MWIRLSSIMEQITLDKNLDYFLILLIPSLSPRPLGYEQGWECFNEWAII